jgi:hypothetical protein
MSLFYKNQKTKLQNYVATCLTRQIVIKGRWHDRFSARRQVTDG